MNLTLTKQFLTESALAHSRLGSQCAALAALLETMQTPDAAGLPVLELANALLPFGLCIVHRDVVTNALAITEQTDDIDGFSSEALSKLAEALRSSLRGG
jgi:hypothetical protein